VRSTNSQLPNLLTDVWPRAATKDVQSSVGGSRLSLEGVGVSAGLLALFDLGRAYKLATKDALFNSGRGAPTLDLPGRQLWI